MERVLLIGYGNPARLDDGLGPALARAAEAWALPGLTVRSDYQLAVEDAADVARHDAVVFADASLEGPEPYAFRRVEPCEAAEFSSHVVEPEAVMALARRLFGAQTKGYVLGIRGYAFGGFGERLTPRARRNLERAAAFLRRALESSALDAAASD